LINAGTIKRIGIGGNPLQPPHRGGTPYNPHLKRSVYKEITQSFKGLALILGVVGGHPLSLCEYFKI